MRQLTKGTEKLTNIVNRKEIKFPLLKAAAVLLVCLAAFGISKYLQERETIQRTGTREQTFAPMVAEDNPALLNFKKQFPQREVVLACAQDVTNDTQMDLLVLYTEEGQTRFVTAIAADGKYIYTDPIPAPVENQGIQFKNIDKQAEMEFIISGEKKGAAGYAIYRIIDAQPKDLFGDGMNDCC